MNPRRLLSMMWPILALTLAACGGSGSSGFDIANENAAIERALETRECVGFENLIVCPADAVAPAHGPEHVDTNLDPTGSVSCEQRSPGGRCNFMLAFAPVGFPPDTIFRVASRRSDPGAPWAIGVEPVRSGFGSAPSYEVQVELDVPVGDAPGPGVSVQFAVLAFIEPRAPLPTEVERLVVSGADYAFVTAPLTAETQPR